MKKLSRYEILKNIKGKFIFKWFDFWIGIYIDISKHRIYFFHCQCLEL